MVEIALILSILSFCVSSATLMALHFLFEKQTTQRPGVQLTSPKARVYATSPTEYKGDPNVWDDEEHDDTVPLDRFNPDPTKPMRIVRKDANA